MQMTLACPCAGLLSNSGSHGTGDGAGFGFLISSWRARIISGAGFRGSGIEGTAGGTASEVKQRDIFDFQKKRELGICEVCLLL